MKALQDLRQILRAISREVDVLSAVGGAVEDLERPDFEEREDRALNEEERVFETIFEDDRSSLYRPVPPIGRSERHLFRYFLDGSFRSYFLGTVRGRIDEGGFAKTWRRIMAGRGRLPAV
jgi:hypothetical protein